MNDEQTVQASFSTIAKCVRAKRRKLRKAAAESNKLANTVESVKQQVHAQARERGVKPVEVWREIFNRQDVE